MTKTKQKFITKEQFLKSAELIYDGDKNGKIGSFVGFSCDKDQMGFMVDGMWSDMDFMKLMLSIRTCMQNPEDLEILFDGEPLELD